MDEYLEEVLWLEFHGVSAIVLAAAWRTDGREGKMRGKEMNEMLSILIVSGGRLNSDSRIASEYENI